MFWLPWYQLKGQRWQGVIVAVKKGGSKLSWSVLTPDDDHRSRAPWYSLLHNTVPSMPHALISAQPPLAATVALVHAREVVVVHGCTVNKQRQLRIRTRMTGDEGEPDRSHLKTFS